MPQRYQLPPNPQVPFLDDVQRVEYHPARRVSFIAQPYMQVCKGDTQRDSEACFGADDVKRCS